MRNEINCRKVIFVIVLIVGVMILILKNAKIVYGLITDIWGVKVIGNLRRMNDLIFVINNLKYDTDKMELVSERCEYYYSSNMFGYRIRYTTDEVKVWKSRKDNWLLTYKFSCKYYAKALTEIEVKELLMEYDLKTYEKIFGELEEA